MCKYYRGKYKQFDLLLRTERVITFRYVQTHAATNKIRTVIL